MESKLGEIITFYSYKGGVGRSMALANVACLLAQKQETDKNVLMIDWDLEAPGLHQFFHRRLSKLPKKSGLIDLFYDMKEWLENNNSTSNTIEDFFYTVDIDRYIVKVDYPSLCLMPAGNFSDGLYSSKVNQFDWADFFDKFPLVITQFAEYLRKKFKYVLIDSRTGYTDISGICTSIMPEKLITVFTPNRQSISGIVEMIKRATDYRKQSDDLRPLMIFPLASRIENAEIKLQKDWRFGNSDIRVEGYQKNIENVLKKVYSLENCDLTKYFDEYQLQYVPRYSYGEEISTLSERSEDRLSLARSFENFAERIIGFENPWEEIKDSIYRSKVESNKRLVDIDEDSRIKVNTRRKLILQSTVTILVVAVIALIYFSLSNFVIPLFSQSQSTSQFFYNLLNSQYFGLMIILWTVIDIIWVGRWRALLVRISKLIAKPTVFVKDNEPNTILLYPRQFLELLAQRKNIEDNGPFRNFVEAQRNRLFDSEHPLRSLGYLIAFVGFIFFALADSIVIANTMVLMQIMSSPLPVLLQRLDYAVLGGSFLSAIVGIWILIEMSGKGELLNTYVLNEAQKRIYKIIASVIILVSVLVTFALAYERLIILGFLETSLTTDLISSFILYMLLAINSSLAAALTFSSASSGLIVFLFLLVSIINSLTPLLAFFSDVIWRLFYIFADILIWAFFTPIIAIPYSISKLFSFVDERRY